jgi:CheY-like chemotaxis protein
VPLLSTSRGRGTRSRAEVDAERQKPRDDTNREIDAIIAEFHAALPRDQARAVGAVFARYSSRYQHSVADQVRGCLQAAAQQGICVPREHVYFNVAVRGAKQRRPDLDRLQAALARKAIQALLILTTNRLSYKSLQFVEEELVGRGACCRFVKSGVDTADDTHWRMLLNHFAAIDEFVTSMYAENIRVAQEGLFNHNLVSGTSTFGHRAREVAGSPTRKKRPRHAYEVGPETAPRPDFRPLDGPVNLALLSPGGAIAHAPARLSEYSPRSSIWSLMKPVLLIADSDAELCDIYQQFLGREGYEVVIASDGLDCLEKLRRVRPAALVLDLVLRWGGGDGVLAWLREESAGPGVAVVLTATGGHHPGRGEDTGPPVVRFLPKPFCGTLLGAFHRLTSGGNGP